jgi:hypothetical protein
MPTPTAGHDHLMSLVAGIVAGLAELERTIRPLYDEDEEGKLQELEQLLTQMTQHVALIEVAAKKQIQLVKDRMATDPPAIN